VQRLPARVLDLGDAAAEPDRIPPLPPLDILDLGSCAIAEGEAERSGEGQVRLVSRPERVDTGMHPDLLRYRTVNDEQRPRAAQAGQVVELIALIGHRTKRRDENGKVLRPAARHDRIDGGLLCRDLLIALGYVGHHRVRLEPAGLEKLCDRTFRRGNDGQAVRPPQLVRELYGLLIAGGFMPL
jgi:hypothetical protein